MSGRCEHVPNRAEVMVIPLPTPGGHERIACPCCGLQTYQVKGYPLDEGDPCPYCLVQPVLMSEAP